MMLMILIAVHTAPQSALRKTSKNADGCAKRTLTMLTDQLGALKHSSVDPLPGARATATDRGSHTAADFIVKKMLHPTKAGAECDTKKNSRHRSSLGDS